MGISSKGKRKITVDGIVYWWFVRENHDREPIAQIIADDHSFLATCNSYCPYVTILKDGRKGPGSVPVPREISDRYVVFTPQYIEQLIKMVRCV